MNDKPIQNRPNGRNHLARFVAGNPGGPGNPFVSRTAEYRRAIREAVGPDTVVQIIGVLIKKALEGDVIAAREVLDRVLGKARVNVEVDHRNASIEELRARVRAIITADPHALARILGADVQGKRALPTDA